MREKHYHWGQDPYWSEALDAYFRLRDGGTKAVTIDIAALEPGLFRTDIAYRLAEAMASVVREEGLDGYRGAPRLLLATIAKLVELGLAKVEE